MPRTTTGGSATERRRAIAVAIATTMLVLTVTAVTLVTSTAVASQSGVPLGAAESFAVLAGAGITNTGDTTITGDVGSFPTPAQTGFGSVTLHGTNHYGDATTQQAKTALVGAYNEAAGRQPRTTIPTELGNTTLVPGVYTSLSTTFELTGTLTLDAQGDPNAQFIFQTGATLVTAVNSRVRLIGSAEACHVVWQVGSSATFHGGTAFVGDVLAMASITAETGASFSGRLLAREGAVTLDTNTITATTCAQAAPPTGTGTPTGASTASPTATTTPPVTPTAAPTGPPTQTPTQTPTLTPTVSASGTAGPISTATPSATATSAPDLAATPPNANVGTGTGTGSDPAPGTGSGVDTGGAPSGPSSLPVSGSRSMELLGVALLLIAAGAAVLLLGRRPRRAA